MSRATIGELDRALGYAFRHEWAEDWDKVGLIAGDPSREITRVLVSLDARTPVVARAAELGANVLVTHHPVWLKPAGRIVAGEGAEGGAVFQALDAGVALIAEHTNLDRAPEGARALPRLLGLAPLEPVERTPLKMVLMTVYAPPAAAGAIVDAMSAAGAGRIGDYEGAVFASTGTGSFTPVDSANPAVGELGRHTSTEEVRIEMACPESLARRVMLAARGAHPYEEPLIVAERVEIARGAVSLGMLCGSDIPLTATSLAERAHTALGAGPRIWGGSDDRALSRIVTATGSASSLIEDALAIGADALVCGEVRYHDALAAADSGLCIIELGHDVSEWPLVTVLAAAVKTVPGIDPAMVIVDEPTAAWRTLDGR